MQHLYAYFRNFGVIMNDSKKNKPYFTKRILIRKSTEAFQEASEKAMELLGYIVVARDGWVVKEYKDGTVEKIEKIEVNNKNQKLILD